ncbi:MAG: tRNA epoxyqueuosine(34) reductase QueG [Thermoanaerobacteraceae bacterium]|nr:tRNA epoxyqueuosine(34) reductase QueG [Thermoanaerobacteraceae bacterium]
MKDRIKEYAKSIGFDLVGFTDADVFDIADVLRERGQKGYLSGLEKGDIEERIDPEKVLPGARSIIALGLYYGGAKKHENGKGRVSRSAWGRDYHTVLGSMMGELVEYLKKEYGAKSISLVDNNPMVEREIARRAGIGFYGKNCSIINPDMGSWIFLGEILTDLSIEPDAPLEHDCDDCERCIKACPTGAIAGPYEINAKKCLSYITVMKGFVPEEMKDKLQNRIYGCDICQEACPYNKINFRRNPTLALDIPYDMEDLSFILSMDNKRFMESFKQTSAGWRGRTVLQRNALIAAGNMRIKGLADTVAGLLADQRPVIRGTAAWALSRIMGAESLDILHRAYDAEKDEDVKREIEDAMYWMKEGN